MSDDDGARFSPQPTKNQSCCAAKGCFSKASSHPTLRFHIIPKSDVDFIFLPNESGSVDKVCRRDVWLQRLQIADVNTGSKRVCSLHFRRSDYMLLPNTVSNQRKKYMKKDAIPSCNLPRTENESFSIENSETIIKEEPEDIEIKLEPLDEEIDETDRIDITYEPIQIRKTDIHKHSKSVNEETDLLSYFKQLWDPSTIVVAPEVEEKTSFTRNMATQTDRCISVSKLMNVLKTNKDLNIITGIPNFSVLGTIVDVVEVISPRLTQVKGLSLGIEDRIIMTFMKLKQDLNYGALSTLFQCRSKQSCRRIIIQTIDIMSRALKTAIRWPEKHEIRADLASSIENLSNVSYVINRIEIAIRSPEKIPLRIATVSRYKGYHSVKFMTVVTLDGSICYLSKAYGGRTSHRTLFENSKIVELIKKNDGLMVLKDFPIDDICQRKNMKLVKSLYKQMQNEIPIDYRVRLNVNRRFLRFKIFQRELNKTLTSRIERILIILCAVENLNLLNSRITYCIRS